MAALVIAALTIGLFVGGTLTTVAAAPFAYVVGYPPNAGYAEMSGSLGIVDLATQRKVGDLIPIPPAPQAVAATRRNDRIIVLHFQGYGPGFVSVLSTPDVKVLAKLPVAQYPKALALSPDERRVYVGAEGGLTVLDLEGGRVITELSIDPSTLAVAPDGQRLYYGGSWGVGMLDTVTFKTRQVHPAPAAIVVPSRDGKRLYVVNPDDWSISGPFGQAIPQPGKKLIVIDLATLGVAAEVPLPQGSYSAVLSVDGRTLYVVRVSDPVTISVINTVELTENRITTTLPGMTARRLGLYANGLLALSPDEQRLLIVDLERVYVVDISTGALVSTIENPWTTSLSGSVDRLDVPVPERSPVVEFYHAGLDHYFSTQHQSEIADLDAGIQHGWTKTGEQFDGYIPGRAGVGAFPVCRFYGLPTAGLNSHFYSANAGECARVASEFPNAWLKETDNAFESVVPDLLTGACPRCHCACLSALERP